MQALYKKLKSTFNGKKVLITGGMGFMGSNLAHDLVLLGSDVVILDAMLEGYGANRQNIADIADKVTVVVDDLRTSPQLENHVQGVDFVFHYAAQVSHEESFKNPYVDLEMNCWATLRLLDAIRKIGGRPKLVYAGTRGQYGMASYLPIDEMHKEFPLTPYGCSKFAAEKYCLVYGRVHGLKVTSLRFANVYGPRHQMRHAGYGILNWFIRQALLKQLIEIWNGRQLRDFLYADDANEAALMAAATARSNNKAFIISSGNSVSLSQAVRLIASLVPGVRYKIISYPKDQKPFEVGDIRLNNLKARRELGWKPTTRLQDGLKSTVSFYTQNMQHYF